MSKADRIFRSMPIEFDGFQFYFNAEKIELKKNSNEKKSLIFEFKEIKEDQTKFALMLFTLTMFAQQSKQKRSKGYFNHAIKELRIFRLEVAILPKMLSSLGRS